MAERMIHVCPTPGCNAGRFLTTAHITQTWEVDKDGNFMKEISTDEVVHGPDNDNEWTCAECGAEAVLKKVDESERDEFLRMKKNRAIQKRLNLYEGCSDEERRKLMEEFDVLTLEDLGFNKSLCFALRKMLNIVTVKDLRLSRLDVIKTTPGISEDMFADLKTDISRYTIPVL